MSNKPISILFFGTPTAAVESLEALLADDRFSVSGVVTQPDKRAGRGQKLTRSPVAEAAAKRGLPVIQPENLKGITTSGDKLGGTPANQALLDFLNGRERFDLFVVVAFGQIIPQTVIDLPTRGIINVHFSLLPRWRGAAPIQRAIAAGDKKTGVSIMRIEAGLDTGPVYSVREIAIGAGDNFGTVHDALSALGAKLLVETAPKIVSGELEPAAQSHAAATHAAKWDRVDTRIHWSDPAQTTVNRIRASSPQPGARAALGGELVKVFAAATSPITNIPLPAPGTLVAANRAELIVAAGDGTGVAIKEIQFPGKRRMAVKDYLAGNPIPIGTRFEDGPVGN